MNPNKFQARKTMSQRMKSKCTIKEKKRNKKRKSLLKMNSKTLSTSTKAKMFLRKEIMCKKLRITRRWLL